MKGNCSSSLGVPFLATKNGTNISKLLTRIIICMFAIQAAQALIDDPVSQKTYIRNYNLNTNLMFQHAYFDISFNDGGELIASDSLAFYQLSRQSSRSYKYFQFFKTFHGNMTTVKVQKDINLEGYKVYGMCQYQGSLDYVIALHVDTNEVRVIRLTYDEAYELAEIWDYKVVDKDKNLMLQGDINVDCKYMQTYRNVNTYVIGILGSYFESNSIISYYFAKFNTKYNLTEYFIKSDDPTVMEIPRRVRIDIENQRIYLAIEINKNKYLDQTVYKPGDKPGEDNSNVAIICYSWNYGTRIWANVVGNEYYLDSMADMEIYGNNVYVVTNSFSTKYSTNSSQTDIYYYRMRSENGYIENHQIFGSPTDDVALDLVVNFNGPRLLALIGSPFLPHKDSDKQWKTQNEKQNIALLLLDFQDGILEIESYDLSLATTPKPYPTRMFVSRDQDKVQERYTLVSHRSNLQVDKRGGLFITYLQDYNAIFSQTLNCQVTGCARCNSKKTTMCLECSNGYFLWKHNCYGSCPQFSYQIFDQDSNAQNFCQDCHYQCKSCVGPKDDQCQSCCTNGDCGAVYDRVPLMGKCKCPSGMKESNGICSYQCGLNLGASTSDRCYPQCPFNSYPDLQYDGVTAQERTEYNTGSSSACELYNNHLKFDRQSKGLKVAGPQKLNAMPPEFSIGFWVAPSVLGTNSYFLNAFGRALIYSMSSTRNILYKFMNGASTSVQPTYTPANQQLSLSEWNYVAISQREFVTNNVLMYEIQLGLATSNFGTLMSAGYTNTIPVQKYGLFRNMLYLGANNDMTPESFTGYMKDVRVFTQFHGLAQMKDEAIRLYRLYSYDDPTLIAYWKLTEGYSSTNIQYTLYDYSINQNQITYSLLSEPDYPSFLVDSSKPLSLCYFHDVKTCRSLVYNTLPPIATSVQQYVRELLNVAGSKLTFAANDQIQFLPNNTDCSQSSRVLAKMTYTNGVGWEVKDDSFNPLYLREGQHYQLCYMIAKTGAVFNVAQLYPAFKPRTIDPSTGHIYNRTDNQLQWMTGGGDQAYGDLIRFSYDCDQPLVNETEMMRSNNPDYVRIYILNTFNRTGDFFFCWNPVFMQDYSPLPLYESVHNLKYKIQYEPTLSGVFRTVGSVNEDIFQLDITGTFVEGDQYIMTWKGYSYSDCNPANQIGDIYKYNHSAWPSIWIGYGSGIHGIEMTQMDELQACWKPGADNAPNVFIRVKKEDLSPYIMRVVNYNQQSNQRSPELETFDPEYGSATLTQSDRIIKFNFKAQQVIPSSDGAGNPGKIIIFRGAVKEDGTYIKTNQILWQNTALNENTLPDPFQQGDLICTQTGQCSIILSQDSNRMKAGEAYFLTFYSYSFLTYYGSNKYFLFNTKYPVNTPVYDHLFFCRSYDVYPSDALVNGDTLVVNGLDLKSKVIKAKYQGNNIVSDTFHTKAINVRLKVYNTDQYFCTFNRPMATVAMEDVSNNSFAIRNLQLRQCNQGSLFAEYIEVIRGIRDKFGEFTYLRSEKMYNVQLGTIGCHSSCSVCNGTEVNNCQICTKKTDYLFDGRCISKCPAAASFITSYSITHQNLIKSQAICVDRCPFGFFNDPESGVCVECNPDCQTCSSAEIASCLSCNPNKQLLNGICVEECPSPHHSNNYTSYVCNQISSTKYLQVKILSLGFINKIPKDKQIYLKADINNTNGGTITQIKWEQLEPDIYSNPDTSIFSNNTDTLHNESCQIVGLNNNALMKISASQVVKVKCLVTNSIGEIAYDISEFFLNDSPFLGDMVITKVGELSNSTGSSIDTQWRIDLTNWYDSPDDTSQMLKLKVFVIRTYKIGLSTATQQYTITDQLNYNTIFVRLPPFAIDQQLVSQMKENDLTIPAAMYRANISICVMAEDMFFATSTKCKDFLNVQNKVEFTSNYTYATEYIKALNISGNLSHILLASNIIFQSVQQPLRPNQQDAICTLDIHCNYNGVCSSEFGIQKCECYQGYFGTYCSFQENQLQDLRNISNTMVSTILGMIKAKPKVKPFDLEVIGNVVRGVTSSPDLVDDETFVKILELMDIVSNATFYSHKPMDSNLTQMLIDSYSNSILKIHHSFKTRRAMKDTVLLGMGVSLLQYSNSFQLSSNPADLSQIRNKQYYLNDDQKPYLIGGMSSPRKRKLYLSEGELNLYEEWGRRIDRSLNKFIEHVMEKMDPLNNQVLSRTKSFDLMLNHKQTTKYIGRTYVRSKDAYWNFPKTIWDKQQGVASKRHEVRQKIMKHLINPFKFERNPGVFLESNITTVEYYSIANNEIPVELDNGYYVDYREPFNQSMGFDPEFLQCMAWDEDGQRFANDGSCTFSKIWEIIPCSDCDQYNQINTTISLCRCTHLSRFGVIYQQTNKTQSTKGLSPGIYSDFFAMKYWNESFGYLASIAGMVCFITGHIFIWFIDKRLRHNLIVGLREKVRRFELQYGARMLRRDGLFFKKEQLGIEDRKATKIASKKKTYLKQNQDDVEGLMDDGMTTKGRPTNKPYMDDEEEIKSSKPRRRVNNRKTYQQDQNEEYFSSENTNYDKINEMDAYKNVSKNRKGRNRKLKEDFKVGADFDENDKIIMKRLQEEKRKKLMKNFEIEEDDDDRRRDLSMMTPAQRSQYERHQQTIKNIKDEINPQQLYHHLMAIKYEDVDGMTKKEFRRKIMIHLRKLPKELAGEVKEYLAEIRGQLNSTDEEMYLNMQDIFVAERERRELSMFKLKQMIIHGSYLLSIFSVTSLLSPRHIRWSLFFCNVVMLWFICAVFFNNTKDPLAVPDFNKKASSLAIKDMWISFLAPFGSTILMYILSSFLKMPNSQLLNVVTLRQLEGAIIEYRKESMVRFLMGYIIVFVIMGTIFWYVIQFTATFGWKVSWIWWYAGIVAIFLQFAIVDPAFSIANYFLFKVHKKSGRLCLRIRSVTQGYNELFENSDDEKNEAESKKTLRTTQQSAFADPENPPQNDQPQIFVEKFDSIKDLDNDKPSKMTVSNSQMTNANLDSKKKKKPAGQPTKRKKAKEN